jgi:hypothetical protein
MPLARGARTAPGQAVAVTSGRWHPDYPQAGTLEALSMLFAGYEASGEILTSEPDWWIHNSSSMIRWW